jgi:hypothetical protein
MTRRGLLEALSFMLGPELEPDPPAPDERQPSPSENRITWVDRPASPPASPAPRRPARRSRPPPQPPVETHPRQAEKRIEWDGAQATDLPDLERLVGIEDAFEHTPLEPGERIAYCRYDRVAYHLSTWEFLRKENGGRCCSCGRSGTIQLFTLPGPAGKQSLPAPAAPVYRGKPASPAWQGSGQEIIGLENVYEYIGQAVVVEAQVYEVYKTMSTGTYFVRFSERQAGDTPFSGFKLVIFSGYESEWSRAGLSPRLYAGRRIRVRGLIQAHPTWGIEILVNSPRLIQILEPDSPD